MTREMVVFCGEQYSPLTPNSFYIPGTAYRYGVQSELNKLQPTLNTQVRLSSFSAEEVISHQLGAMTFNNDWHYLS